MDAFKVTRVVRKIQSRQGATFADPAFENALTLVVGNLQKVSCSSSLSLRAKRPSSSSCWSIVLL
jgi:hypothetical protein